MRQGVGRRPSGRLSWRASAPPSASTPLRRRCRRARPSWRRRRRPIRRLRAVRAHQRQAAHKRGGLRHRQRHPEDAIGRGARATASADQMDAPRRLWRSAIQLRRDSRHPRAEPRPAPCEACPTCPMVHAETCQRLGLATANLGPRSATSSPARDSTIAPSPTRAPSPSRRTSPSRFEAIPSGLRRIGRTEGEDQSGCINACGHHHVGHIGILGVDKKGEEFYQLTLGGSGDGGRAASRDGLGPSAPRRARGRLRSRRMVDAYYGRP